ncbi:MAG TPA: threonylcarbamoyl-AMP synthase [Euryarchaeota archaeon]|nr:threonylcarbamoyl-AMP synthase [Euryarchaeota archaeon]
MKIMHECRHKESGCFELGRCLLGDMTIERMIDVLNNGGTMVFPTDTLYALGADPYNSEAVEKVFHLKNRSFEDPVSIAVSDVGMLKELAVVNEHAQRIVERFLPGPVTLVMEAKEPFPKGIIKNGKLGIRIPRHPLPLQLVKRFGPIICTSANLTGQNAPMDAVEVVDQLGEGMDVLIDCGRSHHGVPSSVIDVSTDELIIIREGVLRSEDLLQFW